MRGEQRQTWSDSSSQSWRLLPEPSDHLRVFLNADGMDQREVLQALRYHRERAGGGNRELPDPRRYREYRYTYVTVGLLYEDAQRRIHLTELGRAVRRWLPWISERNFAVLGRHAAYALAACQLSNPTRPGRTYHPDVVVFPFAFIWRAMLALDGRINSEELNRAAFAVRDETMLPAAVERIREYRRCGDPSVMGATTVGRTQPHDRIISWMASASFGWTLIADKRGGEAQGYYEIRPRAVRVLQEAAQVRHRYRNFASVQDYVEHIANMAALPPDLR